MPYDPKLSLDFHYQSRAKLVGIAAMDVITEFWKLVVQGAYRDRQSGNAFVQSYPLGVHSEAPLLVPHTDAIAQAVSLAPIF